jgi:hypothetical protein
MTKLLTNPDEYRGLFISEFAELERSMDMFLADYFIPDDINCAIELITILIDRITFENKRTALRAVFERRDVLQKSVYKKLLEDIRKLSVIRNYFAHYKTVDFDKSEVYYPKIKDKAVVIGLVQLRDGSDDISYTNVDFYNEINKIRKCKEVINKIINEERTGY